ncbi:N-formyl peptide receptor 2 [Biomphalaria pfeifferi]|uniref:N-formyl peptide receptor 2 n=1 Tax=Biomphalaria pfeifferi TaxID=112525 RepID=A0AAD8BPQ5_BIOPF|nr:N-formyl peptide receptor 2 [Biomphalaria pfeifferi]
MNSSCHSVTSICYDVIAITVSSAVSKFDQVLVSDEVLLTFTSVVDTWSSLVIAFLGIVCNVLTIIVFAGLGFKDTVNITMTVIAFWDLVRVLCGAIHRCYGPLSLLSPSLGKSWQNITIPNINSLQNIASNVAYVIGGYVALERCLCISFPFRVKSLMTPKVTWLACSALSIIVLASLFPSLFLLEIQWMKSTGQYELKEDALNANNAQAGNTKYVHTDQTRRPGGQNASVGHHELHTSPGTKSDHIHGPTARARVHRT